MEIYHEIPRHIHAVLAPRGLRPTVLHANALLGVFERAETRFVKREQKLHNIYNMMIYDDMIFHVHPVSKSAICVSRRFDPLWF